MIDHKAKLTQAPMWSNKLDMTTSVFQQVLRVFTWQSRTTTYGTNKTIIVNQLLAASWTMYSSQNALLHGNKIWSLRQSHGKR